MFDLYQYIGLDLSKLLADLKIKNGFKLPSTQLSSVLLNSAFPDLKLNLPSAIKITAIINVPKADSTADKVFCTVKDKIKGISETAPIRKQHNDRIMSTMPLI